MSANHRFKLDLSVGVRNKRYEISKQRNVSAVVRGGTCVCPRTFEVCSFFLMFCFCQAVLDF